MSSKKVAVIGGGAAGLVAARELRREGHKVVVFERGTRLGGIWVYSPEIDSEPLGLDPGRKIVHSSLYKSLRINGPREATGFRDFPFVASDGKCRVKSEKEDDGSIFDETYDAVVVCSGHYSELRIADVPGIELWPGRQVHSHSYRTPEPYRDQVIVLIGSSATATDICQALAGFAKEVHVATRSEPGREVLKQIVHENIFVHPMIERAHGDGTVAFQDGSYVLTNVIIHCTGYKFHYPFLDTGGAVKVDDNRVGPLYKHVFPPALAPRISIIGIPFGTISFYLFEVQSKWIAGVLSEQIPIPSEEKMMEDVEAFYTDLEARGVPKRYTHKLFDFEFKYEDWLAKECGCPPMEEWRKRMIYATYIKMTTTPDTYRDKWDNDNEDLVLQAHQDFVHYLLMETENMQ